MVNINYISNRSVLEIVISVWIVTVLIYLVHTPVHHRTHDLLGHWQYTKIIAKEKRLPQSSESTQSSNPPLYYFLNSLVAPNLLKSEKADRVIHIHYVKFLSAIYGAITLLLIGSFLKKIEVSSLMRLLVLLYIGTTPEYVFAFTSYGNGSLAILLSVLLLNLCFSIYFRWSFSKALLLLITSTCALYTNYSTMLCLLSISIFCFKDFIRGKLPELRPVKILVILLVSLALFLPWFLINNQNKINFFTNTFKNIGTVIKIPVLQFTNEEWKKPWAYPITEESDSIHPSTKNFDYLSYVFVTSVIGEYKFTRPNIRIIWLLIWVHLLVYFFAIFESFKSNITKTAFLLIIFSYIFHILSLAFFNTPIFGFRMNYEHILWNLPCWAVLYTSATQSGTGWKFWGFKPLLCIGVIIHFYVLMTLRGN